jgi:sugar-specific transcriptional regulator TrmB
MDRIPQDLIRSLRKLGLLESEAKIYVTLVMMNNAEVKELIDFLGLSKPSTYESLRSLEDKGLIVLVNAKPITYQAVPPDIGLEILTDTYVKAKEDAKDHFSTLDRSLVMGQVTAQSSDSLWFVFNKKSIDHKIRDMLRNAKKSVFLIASDQYVKHFTSLANTNLDLDITVFSENPRVERSLKKIFKSDRAKVQVISTTKVVGVLSKLNSLYQKEFMQPLEETLLMLNFDNMLFLIVDDAEILSLPALSGDGIVAFNLRNTHAIANMKLQYKDVHRE